MTIENKEKVFSAKKKTTKIHGLSRDRRMGARPRNFILIALSVLVIQLRKKNFPSQSDAEHDDVRHLTRTRLKENHES